MRRSRPSRWPGLIALAVVGLVAGLGIAAYLSLPRIVEVSPAPGAENISPRARLRIAFDRPMDPASVESAFQIDPPTAGEFSWEGNTLVFTPLLAWPLRRNVTVTLNGGRGRNGLPLYGALGWTFLVGRERLLFITGRPPNIHVISLAEGDTPQALTSESFGVNEFTIAPEGTHIVYSAQRADGGADLRAINLDGSGVRDVLLCPDAACREPALSPNGLRLAYERHDRVTDPTDEAAFGEPRVHLYILVTEADTLMGDPENQTRNPRWGPDGRLSFYDAARPALVIQDLNSGAVTYIPVSSGEIGAWSPDGLSIVYPEIFLPSETEVTITATAALTPTAETFYSHLLRVTIATNDTQNLSGTRVDLEDASPAYSHNGAWLAFARKGLSEVAWTPGRQLWRMRADGSDARPLTDDPVYQHSALAWSPDDQWIAFMRFNATDPTEPTAIWVIRVDGTSGRRLVVGGYAPQWMP
jgi:Tol biopolymer transport system component